MSEQAACTDCGLNMVSVGRGVTWPGMETYRQPSSSLRGRQSSRKSEKRVNMARSGSYRRISQTGDVNSGAFDAQRCLDPTAILAF